MRAAAARPLGQVQVGIAMFSATVSSPNTSLSSGAKPTPMRAIRYGLKPTMSLRSNSIEPAAGLRKPMMVRKLVVLPAPLRPTRQMSSPALTSNDTPRKTGLPWMSTARSRTRSISVPCACTESLDRHSGARHRSRVYPRSALNTAQVGYSRLGWREPGIHNPRRWLWIPGSLATLGPRNDNSKSETNRPVTAALAIVMATMTAALFALPADAQEYKIGISAGLTGYAATLDRSWRDGVEIAAATLNAKGGIMGRKLAVVVEDNRSEPQEAVTVYRKMISSDNVNVFISGCVSAGNFAAAGLVVRAQIPMVLCSILPQQPDHVKWAFSTLPPAGFEVAKRFEYLEEKTQIKKG